MRGWVLGALALLGVVLSARDDDRGAPRPAVAEPTSLPGVISSSVEAPANAAPDEVDLGRLRDRLPRNRYWSGLRPAEPDLLGKVTSGTATEEEIARHFADRRAISEDAIAFARAVLDEGGDALPRRGLYELAIELHTARLAEVPRDLAAAHARKRQQDAARQARLR